MKEQLKILLLEDSANDAGLILKALTNAGLKFINKIVDERIGFEHAINHFVPDVILSDHALPAFNSMEALKIVRQNKNYIPFILVTGQVSEEFAVECMKAGADDYILKSSLIRLPSAIEKVITKKEIENEKIRIELLHQKFQNDSSEKLKKANIELQQFAYIVSHDLKAPLKAITSLADWIEEDLGTAASESIKKNMNLLKIRINRMEALITGVLEYSRIGKVIENTEHVDVNLLLTELIDSISPPATFNIAIKENMPVLTTQKTKLQQVFSNLISNAVKFNNNPLGGKVTIDCNTDKIGYCFSVEDNGPGIEQEYHEEIFKIFQTLQSRDKIESTGIGLSIVKKIVEEQGGKVWVESQKGKGVKFLFTWATQ